MNKEFSKDVENDSEPSWQDDLFSIVQVKKNSSGVITEVMLDNGNIFSIDDAIMMAKGGEIKDVNVGTAKNGREYLRGVPNGIETDNLDNLPTF